MQGVWFRAGTAEQATAHGVRGHARNLADGTVEVVALGAPEAVESLLSWLWEGPPLAKVTDVLVEEIDPSTVKTGADGFSTG